MDYWDKALGFISGAGIAGFVLFFILRELAPEMRAIWRAIDRLTRTLLIWRLSSPNVAPAVKEDAAVIIAEMDEEEERGKVRDKRLTQAKKENTGRGPGR